MDDLYQERTIFNPEIRMIAVEETHVQILTIPSRINTMVLMDDEFETWLFLYRQMQEYVQMIERMNKTIELTNTIH